MKTLPLWLLLVSLHPAFAADPTATPAPRATFYERFFGDKMANAGRAPEKAELISTDESSPAPATPLVGKFLVTATNGNRAVLRTADDPATRIIADFPPAKAAPKEGMEIVLSSADGLVVTRVRRGADGTRNVFAGPP